MCTARQAEFSPMIRACNLSTDVGTAHLSADPSLSFILLVLGWLEIAITVCWRVPIDYSWLVLKKHTCASWCPRNGICIFFKKKEKLGTMKPQQPQPCPPQKEQSKGKKKLVYHNPQGRPTLVWIICRKKIAFLPSPITFQAFSVPFSMVISQKD